MSLLNTIRVKLGLSDTPANNFVLDASADNGTMKLARGNPGATTQNILTVEATGAINTSLMPKVVNSPLQSLVFGGADVLYKGADGLFLFTTQVTIANPAINTYVVVEKALGFTAVGTFIVTATMNSSNAAPTGGMLIATQLNATTLRVIACVNVVSTNIYNVIAIGRWK